MSAPTYNKIQNIASNKPLLSSDEIRSKLKLKQLQAKRNFSERYPHVEKFFKQKGLEVEELRQYSSKLISAGALTSLLLLAAPGEILTLPQPDELAVQIGSNLHLTTPESKKEALLKLFESLLPAKTRPLSVNEEKILEQNISELTGVKVKAGLEGEHLNTSYGRIGLEQHLRRYPGDTLANHGTGKELRAGMAPGLGAWGYFAKSQEQMTKDLEEKEKWYAVVQTLYLSDWNTRQPHLKNWYKHRKVMIVNTKNGQAVVAAIADSGPAAWTGKHFGGSPEVMLHLGGDRYTKGEVLIFFVDDPNNKVPLGPVEYKEGLYQGGLIEI